MQNFFKMSSAGNDYLYTFSKKPKSKVILAVCDRYSGYGSDGVVVIYKRGENFALRVFNSDASFALFCGNATLSVAKYLFDSGLVSSNKFCIHTDSGLKKVTVCGKRICKKVRLEVDKPTFNVDEKLFLKGFAKNKLFTLIYKNQKIRFRASVVGVGNLHLVINADGFSNLKMKKIVSAVNNSGLFPKGVNIEFVSYVNGVAKVVVFERGSGRTKACGSGAIAVFWSLKYQYPALKNLNLKFEGGDLQVELKNKKVYLVGKPKYQKIEKAVVSKW